MRPVYYEPVARVYYGSVCSAAYLLSWLAWLTTFLLPLLLVYDTSTFWPHSIAYREQPSMQYMYQTLLLIEGTARDDQGNVRVFSGFWSTLPTSVNQLAGAALRPGQIQSFADDDNRDGLLDRVSIEVAIAVNAGESVHKASLLVMFNATMQTHAQLCMDVMALVSHASPLPGSVLYTVGDLALSFKRPLPLTTTCATPYATDALLNVSSLQHADDLRFEQFMLRQTRRENRATVANQEHVWIQDASEAPRRFVMNATLSVPVSDISYVPTFYERLQRGWVQYYAAFVLVASLVTSLVAFIVRERLVGTIEAATKATGPLAHFHSQ
ncbi:hypothetical protein SDRG_05197 [Saprolegnia diclina VS20]|uniref:Transmembrane protein 231 n=1 Tax=Saprolegnia diclina (strain VS20) TaxID=1156394 RepID=T0RYF3_SAPDV|nr:hypothetical protein SDRG_05197 [Saprolegnia diclina VS20]EQC37603.1 hypothetical protein SDRG_05197 [Saprolegnia diclina VS20]|eukprot:XP_008609123.1 hypothetical protein SDRG_05197 [Saprolegnia diclina VS20]